MWLFSNLFKKKPFSLKNRSELISVGIINGNVSDNGEWIVKPLTIKLRNIHRTTVKLNASTCIRYARSTNVNVQDEKKL